MTVTVSVPVDEIVVQVLPEVDEVNVTINQGVPVPVPVTGGSSTLQKTLLVVDRGEEGDPVSGSRSFYVPENTDYLIEINDKKIYAELGEYTRVGTLVTLSEDLGDLAPNDKILLLK